MKKKLIGFSAFLLSLGMVACGGNNNDNPKEDPKPNPCETHKWGEKETIKVATCTEKGQTQRTCTVCGAKEDPKDVNTIAHNYVADPSKTVNATCSAEGKTVEVCSVCKAEKETKLPKADHSYVAGADTTNSESKTIKNSECSVCHAAKVSIAITDASTGAENIESSGKIKKAATITWKIVAPKAGEVTIQFGIKYGQSGDKLTDEVKETIWGKSGDGQNPYVVKVNDVDATVLVNAKSYKETGLKDDESVADIDFATATVKAGENVIEFTTPSDQYYRNAFSGNVTLVYKA